jgi:hypothetical protein
MSLRNLYNTVVGVMARGDEWNGMRQNVSILRQTCVDQHLSRQGGQSMTMLCLLLFTVNRVRACLVDGCDPASQTSVLFPFV